MNNRTSHIQFKVILDKNAQGVAFGGAPAFLPKEIDIYLNQAQDEILNNKISGNNPLRQGFEANLQRMSQIDKLVVTDNNLQITNQITNEFLLEDVHDGGKRMMIVQFELKYGNGLAKGIIMNHQDARLFKQTYDNIPWVEHPVATLEDDNMLIYVDPIIMNSAGSMPVNGKYMINLTYIKKPKRFDYTQLDEELDFPEDVMNDIINRAVVLALENIESQRTTGKLQLNQLSE